LQAIEDDSGKTIRRAIDQLGFRQRWIHTGAAFAISAMADGTSGHVDIMAGVYCYFRCLLPTAY
jgi:hypothetical protein